MLLPLEELKDIHELVICDSEISFDAHKELFRFSDNAYITADSIEAVFKAIDALNSEPETRPLKIHLALTWENLLRVSLWKAEEPGTGDLLTLLRNSGITDHELLPFRKATANEIFPSLYYGRRFDILRKICHSAKRQAENHLKNKTIRIVCHLAADQTKKIVASSL